MFLLKVLLFLHFILSTFSSGRIVGKVRDQCQLPESLKEEIAGFKPIVDKIVRTVTSGNFKGKVTQELAAFVDKFGNRLSGTENLEHSIDYMLNKSQKYGLDNVHGEPVQLPHWVRGNEGATLLKPRVAKLPILGLGGSVGTPDGGVTAEVVAVESFDELHSIDDKKVKGKIVVFSQKWVNYGETVKYRQFAAEEGAKKGAVATLVRSVTPFSIASPHTGWQDYSEGVQKIPTACITVEDAQMLLRMYRRGDKVVINLKMEAKTLDPVTSRNTIADVQGSTNPEKVVVVSGHLDSWDVGVGAMDDGAGAFISWYSLVLLKALGLKPRRTVRAILWTGEEFGLLGASAYQKAHESELDNLILLMESDEGTFNPLGMTFKGNSDATCIMQEIVKLLDSINATTLEPSTDVGSDIMVWSNTAVPLAALKNENENYFWFHHSDGDRMVVENPDILDKCLAVWTSVAYVVAELSQDLPR